MGFKTAKTAQHSTGDLVAGCANLYVLLRIGVVSS